MITRHLLSSTLARFRQSFSNNRFQCSRILFSGENNCFANRYSSTTSSNNSNLTSTRIVNLDLQTRFLSTQPKPSSSQNAENDNERHQEEEDNDDDDNSRPRLLMDFVPRGMPNFWYSMKNLFIVNVILRNQIDRNFDYKNFILGARQALIVVSSHLANNRLDSLTGLVDNEALAEIKRNYAKLTVAQRKEYELKPSDIVISFAHNIRIQTLTEEFTGTRKHVVYFFIVFDCIKNLDEILKEKAAERANARDIFQEFAERKYVCNYEFKREYIEGLKDAEPSDWIITKLLHIKEKDLIARRF